MEEKCPGTNLDFGFALSEGTADKKNHFISNSTNNPDCKADSPFLKDCTKCNGTGITLLTGEEYLEPKTCGCFEELSENSWEAKETLSRKTSNVMSASIPNRYIQAMETKVPETILDWYERIMVRDSMTPNFLFITGGVGTGKTHVACALLLRYLLSDPDSDGIYIPVHEVLDRKRRYQDTKFSTEKRSKEHYRKNYQVLIDHVAYSSFVVLDELGQQKLSSKESDDLFKLIDDRYSKNKPTVIISNHCDNKDLSLNGRLLSDFVGARIESRLKSALSVQLSGKDLRISQGVDSVSKEDIKGFKVPDKILTTQDNTQQIMTWLTRNPAFEVVSPARRKQLTEEVNGEKIDTDRPRAVAHQDVWAKGDRLIITGPVCDHEDKKLYALLVKLLSNQHKDGNLGLQVETTSNNLLKLMKISNTGPNHQRLRRQLDRLLRMSINFKNARGHRWQGPLLTEVTSIVDGKNGKLKINFSHFMINFYKIHEYTLFNTDRSIKLKGDTSAFYMFYSSHSRAEMEIGIEKCKKLLGIPTTFDKKEARKRVNKAVANLIKAGIMDPKGTFIQNNKVHTRMLN